MSTLACAVVAAAVAAAWLPLALATATAPPAVHGGSGARAAVVLPDVTVTVAAPADVTKVLRQRCPRRDNLVHCPTPNLALPVRGAPCVLHLVDITPPTSVVCAPTSGRCVLHTQFVAAGCLFRGVPSACPSLRCCICRGVRADQVAWGVGRHPRHPRGRPVFCCNG